MRCQLSPVADMPCHTPWAAMGHNRPHVLQQKAPLFDEAHPEPFSPPCIRPLARLFVPPPACKYAPRGCLTSGLRKPPNLNGLLVTPDWHVAE
jgi:hypothetical protein